MKKKLGALAVTVVLLSTLAQAPRAGNESIQGTVEINAKPTLVNIGDTARWVASRISSVHQDGDLVVVLPGSTTNVTYTTELGTPCNVRLGNLVEVACPVPSSPFIVTVKGTVGLGRSPLVSRAEFRTETDVLPAVDVQFINGIKTTFLPLLIW